MKKDTIVMNLFKKMSEQNEIDAIALGGSRAGLNYDENSDYDVYIYCTKILDENKRRKILSEYCSYMEIGNHFWELEDNCILKSGIDIDLIYRNLDEHTKELINVVEKFIPYNGYTTCMWHNMNNSKIIYDRNGNLANVQTRFKKKYPLELKTNIIENNIKLLHNSIPSYNHQISKAVYREDKVNIGNRITAFMDSYFDIIFALNELTHPGEKRLVKICKEQCKILPKNFETNIDKVFKDLSINTNNINNDIIEIIEELEKVISKEFGNEFFK